MTTTKNITFAQAQKLAPKFCGPTRGRPNGFYNAISEGQDDDTKYRLITLHNQMGAIITATLWEEKPDGDNSIATPVQNYRAQGSRVLRCTPEEYNWGWGA